MSTNCVLLADTIVGTAGTDILSARGFISPGTYQDYLDKEFERPHSLVVTKRVYQLEHGTSGKRILYEGSVEGSAESL